MTEQTFKVGDRVRITKTYSNGDTSLYEGTVTVVYPDGDVSTTGPYYYATDPAQIIEKIAPAEPKGLGAVVRDGDGDLLVRVNGFPLQAWDDGDGALYDWDDLNVVEVLSEGIVVE